MSNHASKNLTSVAERLAHLLDSEQGRRILRLLARLNSDGKNSAIVTQAQRPAPAVPAPTPGRIGIWQLTYDNEEASYVRESSGDALGMWSDQPRIELKKGKRRVVLLGESVARGFFYDPWFNPASALKKILSAINETSDIEVIDLARTNCRAERLMEVAASCLPLEPDALVIFAGNNWNPYDGLNRTSFLDIADRLYARQRWEEIRTYMNEEMRFNAESVVESIAAMAKAHSIPVVVLIPEFNLYDWRTDCIETINFLPQSEAMRWRRTRREAEAALQSGDFERAAVLAEEMIDLDQGTTSASLEILARCKMEADEMAEARRLLEMARDTVLWFPGVDSPRCFSVIQEVFRTRAIELGMKVVDLPQRFKEYLGGGIPNYTLFLDYCHLTVEGIRVAMASAAEQLLLIFGVSERSWRELAEVELNVSGNVDATAHFMAAIHNGHWRQGYDLILLHCRQAIQSNPEIADNMIRFLDYYIRRTPTLFCRSFHEAIQDGDKPCWAPYLFMAGYPKGLKVLNPLLINAMLEALRPTATEIEWRTRNLLLSQYGMERHDLDLLHPIHWRISYSMREGLWSEYLGYMYYVSFAPESLFWVPCRRAQELTLTLTHRVREYSMKPRDVIIYVNGYIIATLQSASSWHMETIQVPSEYVQDGFNTIVIAWPGVEWSETKEIQRIAGELELGAIPLVCPIYGELHAFRASA